MKKVAFLFALTIFTGCIVSQEEFYSLQREVASLKKDFRENAALFSAEAGEIKSSTQRLDELHRNLRKSFAETNARIEELEQQINKLKGEKEILERQGSDLARNISETVRLQNEALAGLKAEIKRLNAEILAIKRSQGVIFSNVSSIYSSIITSRQISPADKDGEKLKDALYREALELFKSGNFEKSIEKFSLFTIKYPDDPLSANALYWIGECYYSQKNFNLAVQYFHRVVTDFPNSNKVASALLKEAYSLKELGMEKEANSALEELLYRFPYSEEAQIVKKQRKK